MNIPERMLGKWVATLDDATLVEAEAQLHATFRHEDVAEKTRRGTKYRLLEGPASLTDAWLRWRLVSNETRKRGLATH